MSKIEAPFRRPQAAEPAGRLGEPGRRIQVVAGARQVGKTTLVQQVIENIDQPIRATVFRHQARKDFFGDPFIRKLGILFPEAKIA